MFASLPPATRALILANLAVFLLQHLAPRIMWGLFALWPLGTPLLQPWQLLTYGFLHGDALHLFVNMFALFMFGRPMEEYWGSRRFAIYYFASLLAAAVTQLIVEAAAPSGGPTVGASGGIFGLLLAFAWYFPRQRVFVLPLPVPIPAWFLVTSYGLLELYAGLTGASANIAHFAHLGGMLGGALVILYWRARPDVYRY